MAAHFQPSYVSVLYESILEWINRYNFPGWMSVPLKPHPFENKYLKITCAKYKVIYIVEIVEGKDRPILMVKKDFKRRGQRLV